MTVSYLTFRYGRIGGRVLQYDKVRLQGLAPQRTISQPMSATLTDETLDTGAFRY